MLIYSACFHLGSFILILIVSFSWTSRPLASPVYEVDLVSIPQAKPVSVQKPKKPKAVKPPEEKKPPAKKVEAKKPPPAKKPPAPKKEPKPAPPKKDSPVAAVPPAPKPPVKPDPEPDPVAPEEVPPPEETVEPPLVAAIPAPEPQIQAEVEIPDFEYPYYLDLITRKIGRHWVPPPLKSGSVQEAVVVFTLFSKGDMTGVRIKKSSGNAFLDQAALRAIYQASPFPPLPQEFTDQRLDITMSFSLGKPG